MLLGIVHGEKEMLCLRTMPYLRGVPPLQLAPIGYRFSSVATFNQVSIDMGPKMLWFLKV